MLDVILLTLLAHRADDSDLGQTIAATGLPEPLVRAWLSDAEQRGLVRHAESPETERDQWSLTPAGRARLDQLEEGTHAGEVQTISLELPED